VSPPAPDAIEARLVELAVEHLDVDPARLRPDALLGEDLGVDSLAAIELGMVLEDEFGIELPDEVLADIFTYGDLLAAVRERVPAAKA
jgi:acyl carrier protein